MIIDVEEGIGDRSGMVGRLVCRAANGEEFGASPNRPHDEMQKLWNDREKLIGKKATVKFQNLSKRGVPRIIEGVPSIRDYE